MNALTRTGAVLAALALAAGAPSCGGGGPDNLRVVLREPAPRSRGARVLYTDVREVRVAVTGVRAHPSGFAAPGDPGWIPCDGATGSLDLLEIGRDGRELCFDRLPDGSYRQVRVDFAENPADGSSLESYVVSGGGERLPLETPGGGLAAFVGFALGGGGTVEVVFELDPRGAVQLTRAGVLVLRPDLRVSATTVYGAVSR